MRIGNEDILEVDGTHSTVSLATSQNLKPLYLGHIVNYAIQLEFTGTPAGNFKLQVSNDPGQINATGGVQQYSGVTHWTDVADSAFTVSAAGNIMWEVQNSGSRWVRVVWTATGSGSTPVLTYAQLNCKGI